MESDKRVRIAVVGDVHDQWEAEDAVALKNLNIDLVLFVGDFGNESVEVVSAIASLNLPKVTIMGNHDAWYTASGWGRKKSPYDHKQEDRVQQQLDLLGEAAIGYRQRTFPELGLAVVGSRPFSWGGQDWKNAKFYRDYYGVEGFTQSTEKILEAVKQTPDDIPLIFLGHNGPYGLGDAPEDTCGRDWNSKGGDYGDPDLRDAIAQTRKLGKPIPLVTFGHMHHRLRHTKTRLRTRLCQSPEGTIYLNAASVPRILDKEGQRLRNFSIVELQNGIVQTASLVWVAETTVVSQEVLYEAQSVPQP
jgi:uncharacterized protein (TIGR04168 family)